MPCRDSWDWLPSHIRPVFTEADQQRLIERRKGAGRSDSIQLSAKAGTVSKSSLICSSVMAVPCGYSSIQWPPLSGSPT